MNLQIIKQHWNGLMLFFTKKMARMLITAFIFLGLCYIGGSGTRPAQQIIMLMFTMVILGLFLRNIWITLFLWWTVFLFFYFKFNHGAVYLHHIFYGVLIYYMVKKTFKKEHIEFFLNAFLIFVIVNILYICLQINGWDRLYYMDNWIRGENYLIWNIKPIGFMGFEAGMGMFMALGIPLLVARKGWVAKLGGIGLLVPILISKSSANVIAAVIGIMFVLFFQMRKKYWICIVIGLVSLGTFYTVKIDRPNPERWPQWKMALGDAVIHPIVGWGLDSFRKPTKEKPFTYAKIDYDDGKHILILEWDNPHNLGLSLFLEWGVFGLLILIGYLRQICLWFRRAIKTPQVLGMGGSILVLFLLSGAHFPLFLARIAVPMICIAALFEVATREDTIVI